MQLYCTLSLIDCAKLSGAKLSGVSDASICQMQGIFLMHSTGFHNATGFVGWSGAGGDCQSKNSKLRTHSSQDMYQTYAALCLVKVKDKR